MSSASGFLTGQELQALHHVAAGQIVFHNGLWGAEMCYMWAGDEPGRGAGRVTQSQTDALDRLVRRRLVTVRPGRGPVDVFVVLTELGQDVIGAGGTAAA